MKIGFSFGLCVNDIANGIVDINDVLLIVCRTHMDSEEVLKLVIDDYIYMGRIKTTVEHAVEIGMKLYKSGRLFQPRLEGFYPVTLADADAIWMDLAPTLNSTNENAVAAWKNYQMFVRLVEGEKPAEPGHIKRAQAKAEDYSNPSPKDDKDIDPDDFLALIV